MAEEKSILTLHQRRVLELVSQEKYFTERFYYYPFPRIEKGLKFAKLEINSLRDIAVDKTHTVVLKPRARDYIDLYFILQKENFKFHDLLLEAKTKFNWDITAVEWGSRLMQASEMSDYPRMLKPIEPGEWQGFFVEEAQKLKGEIFEK